MNGSDESITLEKSRILDSRKINKSYIYHSYDEYTTLDDNKLITNMASEKQYRKNEVDNG